MRVPRVEMMLCAWALAIVALTVSPAGSFATDGNVVAPSGEWSPDYRVVADGDDDRRGASGYEFSDIEDLDEVWLWVDLAGDSLRVAWKTMAPPYPNRAVAFLSGDHDSGTVGVFLDIDADSQTGAPTSRTRNGLPTYASTVIGADIALALTFDRLGDGLLAWWPVPWELPEGVVPSPVVSGTAAFGVTYDRSQLGPNSRWIEGAWSLTALRELWQPILRRPLFQEGDVIGIAGLMSTPAMYGFTGEEITDGGYFLVGWGPVTRSGDGFFTSPLHDARGNLIIPAGLPIRYDPQSRAFLVDGKPTAPRLGAILYGDVSDDGTVSAYDASLVLRYVVGLSAEISTVRGDVTGNGAVTPYDAALILRRVYDPSYRFPVEAPAVGRTARGVPASFRATEGAWELDVPTLEPFWAADMAFEAEGPVEVVGAVAVAQRREGLVNRLAIVGRPGFPVRLRSGRGAQLRFISARINDWEEVPSERVAEPIVLLPPAPNPFNSAVFLSYSLPFYADVSLAVFDVNGRWIQTLADGPKAGGDYRVLWRGDDGSGRAVASGVYLVRLDVGRTAVVRAVVLVR